MADSLLVLPTRGSGVPASSAAPQARWIVMTSTAKMPSGVRASYRNVALVQRSKEYAAENRMPLKIDLRAHGIDAIQHYGAHHVGKTDAGAYQKVFAEAQAVAAKLNAAGDSTAARFVGDALARAANTRPTRHHPIRAYRARRGLTMSAVAARAGITKAALSMIENYTTRMPSPPVIGRLVVACDGEISACDIFRAHYEGEA